MIGYSPKESEFLSLVERSGGYFIRRQFWPKRGGQAQALCQKLLARGHARLVTATGPTQVLQLMALSGERVSPQESQIVLRCLMTLDYLLERPDTDLDAMYVDAGPGTRPGFESWLRRRADARKLVYVTTGKGWAADRKFERVQREVAEYFQMKERALRALFTYSQVELNRFRMLRKRYGWLLVQPERAVFHVTILLHNYDFLGTVFSNAADSPSAA